LSGETHNQAIIIGGSIGGLLAARALADHFKSVTIVEQDELPSIGEHRRGVPQSRHTHGLLAGGRRILEQLFPGLTAELAEAGALPADVARDARWVQEGGYLSRFESDVKGLLLSRPLLEGMIRKRVFGLRNVQVFERCRATGLATDQKSRCVTGIHCIRDTKPAIISGDLIVDAMGRGSPAEEWLQQMGYPRPETQRVEIALGYTTRLFHRRPEHLNGDLIVVIGATPQQKRGGVMLAQENDRWIVTLTSRFGNYAPEDLAGFRHFATTLPAPDIHEVIVNAEPIGAAISGRFPASIRRRYERLSRFPDRFLVFGDSICSFNPVYGQGMSVAALEARALSETLANSSANIAKRFYCHASKLIDIPWSIAVGSDLSMPETVGRRSFRTKLLNTYMSKLHQTAHYDPVPSLAFHRVTNLLAPPSSVMAPRVVLHVLSGHLRPKRTVRSQPVEIADWSANL
jgi:2-polyprenyl-6-methoxyphenol hydroxylase-like FAD-dependent oxidoreductase